MYILMSHCWWVFDTWLVYTRYMVGCTFLWYKLITGCLAEVGAWLMHLFMLTDWYLLRIVEVHNKNKNCTYLLCSLCSLWRWFVDDMLLIYISDMYSHITNYKWKQWVMIKCWMLTKYFLCRRKFWEKDPHNHSPHPPSVVGVSNSCVFSKCGTLSFLVWYSLFVTFSSKHVCPNMPPTLICGSSLMHLLQHYLQRMKLLS